MPTELEFQWLTPAALNLPNTLLGWLYIAIWLVVLAAILWSSRATLRQSAGRQWGLAVLFALLAVAEVIPRFELSGGTLLPPSGQASGAIIYRPLGFLSVGLAAWFLNCKKKRKSKKAAKARSIRSWSRSISASLQKRSLRPLRRS